MNIIGINCYHANSSAALIVNGHLSFAIEEERLNRVKNSGGFPYLSIIECLKSSNLKLNDIDFFAVNSNPKEQLMRKFIFSIKNKISFNELYSKILNFKKKISINEELNKIRSYGSFKGKIFFTEHHLSHIASAFFNSNFENAIGISIDGSGDFTTTSNALCLQNKIIMKNRLYYPHSLGIFYTAISNYLGFNNYGEEYKVMAMGAYGNNSLNSKLEQLIKSEENGTFSLNLEYFLHHRKINTFTIENNKIIINKLLDENKFENLIGFKKRDRNTDLNQNHFNLARSLQILFEEAYYNYINFSYNQFKIDTLCLAGGCAMNSLANGRILDKTPFKKIYIQPAAYDAGGAIGAALYCSEAKGVKIKKTLRQKLYLGPKYSNQEISFSLNLLQNEFTNKNIIIKKFNNTSKLINLVARLLVKKKIIGIFRDRLEWGARALGNRSIIADPRGEGVKDMINLKIKRRESFRPFAPIIKFDCLNDWFLVKREIPSMMEVHKIKEEKKFLIPAVVHKDGTCRLQTVREEDNDFFYNLLTKFNQLTKIPILLNTSFNENEPIVCKPNEAIDTFLRTNMDVLVLENFLLYRKKIKKSFKIDKKII